MKRVIWPLLIALALLTAGGALRLQPDGDLLELTPDVPGRDALVDALGAFGLQAPFYVHLRVPEGTSADALVDLLDDAETRLLADPAIGDVIRGFDAAQLDSILDAMSDLTPVLADAADPAWRSPEALEAAVDRARAQLVQPGTASSRRQILVDPYGWGPAAMSRLGLGEMSASVTMHRGRVLSTDLRAGFLTATAAPDAGVAAVDAARRVTAELMAESPDLVARVAGPGAQAAAGERTVRSDITRSLWLGCTLLGFLFFFATRNPLAPIWMVTPAVVAVAAGVGAFGWTGWELHSLTLAFASALMGLCVDFPIHLASAVGDEEDRGPEGVWRALRSMARPAAACGATSVFAFSLLLLSSSPLLRELGGLGAVTLGFGVLVGTGGLAWFAATSGVQLDRSPPKKDPPPATISQGAGFAAAAVVVLLALGLPFLALDGNPRSLQASGPELEEAEARFAEDFGDNGTPALLFLRAADAGEALQQSEDVASALRSLEPAPLQVLALSDGLPAPSVATERCAALVEVDLPGWRAAFDAVATDRGLRAGAFAPFFARLEQTTSTQCAGDKDFTTHPFMNTPLMTLLSDRFLRTVEEGVVGTVLVVPPPGTDRLPPGWRAAAEEHAADSVWAFVPELSAAAGSAIGRDVFRLGSVAVLACFFLLTWTLGSWRGAGLALVTPVLALLATAGAFGWMTLLLGPLPAVGIGACVLILGLGIDDGIYVVHALVHDPARLPAVRRAIVLTTLTSLLGFGVLALAQSPGLAALGRVASVGLLMDLVVALLVVPALWKITR